MVVDPTLTIKKSNPEHLVEFGEASWSKTERSNRRRKNLSNGKFDPFSSSEIPLDGYLPISDLIIDCVRQDQLSKQQLTEILIEILKKNSVTILNNVITVL